MDVAEHIGVSFDNPVLWDWKSQELYSTEYELLLDAVKEYGLYGRVFRWTCGVLEVPG